MRYTRRDFLKFAGLSSLAGASAVVGGGRALASEGTRKIEVIPFMTSGVALHYILDKAGVSVGPKKASDLARGCMSVEFGANSPKSVYVGTNTDRVVLSDQIAWELDAAKAERYAHKKLVERTPKDIEFIFPGDSLVLDLDSVPASNLGEAVKKQFGEGLITLDSYELNDFLRKKYLKTINHHVERIKGLSLAVDGEGRKDRFYQMATENPLEFLARQVDERFEKGVYSGWVQKDAILFAGDSAIPVEDDGAVSEEPKEGDDVKNAVEHPNHGDDLASPQFYLGVAFRRPGRVLEEHPYLSKIGNVGITPLNPEIGYIYDLKLQNFGGSGLELVGIIGSTAYNNLVDKELSERKLVKTGAREISEVIRDFDVYRELVGKAVIVDTTTGNVGSRNAFNGNFSFLYDVDTGDLGDDYDFIACAVQRVRPNKE